MRLARSAYALLPGLALCIAVTAAAAALQALEVGLTGQAYLEALVLAILLGGAIRMAWTPGARWHAGIAFSAETLLEVAVVLLGASVSVRTVLALGPALLGGIVAVVAVAIASSYAIGRVLGLKQRMAPRLPLVLRAYASAEPARVPVQRDSKSFLVLFLEKDYFLPCRLLLRRPIPHHRTKAPEILP